MSLIVTTEVHGENVYYKTEARKVDYSISFWESSKQWEVYSKRQGLGRLHVGTFRYYKNLEELESAVKSLRGIAALITGEMGVAH